MGLGADGRPFPGLRRVAGCLGLVSMGVEDRRGGRCGGPRMSGRKPVSGSLLEVPSQGRENLLLYNRGMDHMGFDIGSYDEKAS